jgi:hypothetical protein
MSAEGPAPQPESDIDAKWLANAIRAVQMPGTLLLWYGVASLFLAVASLIIYLVSPDTIYRPIYDWQLEQQREQLKEDPAHAKRLDPYREWVRQPALVGTIGSIVSVVCSFLIAIGGVKMRHLSGFGWSVTASILSILPFSNSCCCVGLPIGVGALVVLFGSDVRLAFKRVGKAGGLEAFGDVQVPREDPPSRPVRLE